MSEQYAAEASQKFTWPCFTAVVPALTVAVSLITAPALTEVTTTPPEVTASEVVVPANAEELIAAAHTISMTFSNGRRATVLTDANWIGEDMLLDPYNRAPCSRTFRMEERRRTQGFEPECRLETNLRHRDISYYLKNGGDSTPISPVSNV